MKIYKYRIQAPGNLDIEMYEGAIPIRAGLDPGDFPCLWAMVPTCTPKKTFSVHVIGTGWDVPVDTKYVGTFNQGSFVWHVFIS